MCCVDRLFVGFIFLLLRFVNWVRELFNLNLPSKFTAFYSEKMSCKGILNYCLGTLLKLVYQLQYFNGCHCLPGI